MLNYTRKNKDKIYIKNTACFVYRCIVSIIRFCFVWCAVRDLHIRRCVAFRYMYVYSTQLTSDMEATKQLSSNKASRWWSASECLVSSCVIRPVHLDASRLNRSSKNKKSFRPMQSTNSILLSCPITDYHTHAACEINESKNVRKR